MLVIVSPEVVGLGGGDLDKMVNVVKRVFRARKELPECVAMPRKISPVLNPFASTALL